MDKQRVCKICNKRFSNGKAMGGHMRSHLAKLPVPPPNPPQRSVRPSPSSSSSFNLNPKRIFVYGSADYSPTVHSDLSVQDRESDTDSRPRNPSRRRSKRCRDDEEQAEPVSSVSESFSTEDVARCLIMMSRDIWRRGEEVEKEEDFGYDSSEDEDEDEEDDDSLICRLRLQMNHRSHREFKCKTCNKVFRSYQALGGHKASHKKINHNGVERCSSGYKMGFHQRVFECPFCPKVFDSGQALGGHKKVHLSHLGNVRITSHHSKYSRNSIDLNSTPTHDYDDDEEVVSQVDFSAISSPIKLFQAHHR